MVHRLNLPAGEDGVGHETSFCSSSFCKKGRKRNPATQERTNQYRAEIHLRMKATHILAPTRSALRVRRALFTNSHVNAICAGLTRAKAVSHRLRGIDIFYSSTR
jgi:hypothetical protein